MDEKVKADLRQAYDRNAPERDGYVLQDWKIEERRRFLARLRKENKSSLLEIGAGPGRDAQFFRDNGLEVVCTDLSPEMVRLCRAKGLTAHVMDFQELDFPPATFDTVFALNCLLHVPKAELPRVLESIRTVLKPGGLFYLGVWGGNDFEGQLPDDHYEPKRFFSFYTDSDIRRIVGGIFKLVSFRRITTDPGVDYHFQSMILRKV